LLGPISVREPLLDSGTVRIDGVIPGRYDATASCEGVPSQTVSLEIERAPVDYIWALQRLPGSVDNPIDSPPIHSPSGSSMKVALEGEPGVTVAVFAESDNGVPFRGRRLGSAFLFEGLPVGEYRVYVNDYFEQAQHARITRDGESIELWLQTTALGRIRGRVASDDGVSVQDAWVTYFRSDWMMAGATLAPPTLTDQDGEFSLSGVPGVPYTIVVSSAVGDGRVDDVNANEDVLIRVSAAASLLGHVLTADGQSVGEFTLIYSDTQAGTFEDDMPTIRCFVCRGCQPARIRCTCTRLSVPPPERCNWSPGRTRRLPSH
jgi:hypothetical protein